MNFRQQIAIFYKGRMRRHEVFSLGNTPQVLQKCGLDDLEIIMKQQIMQKISAPEKERGHGLSRQIVKDLKRYLENPAMVIAGTEKNSFLIVTDVKDHKQRPIVIAVHSSRFSGAKKANEIRSIYGRFDFDNFICAERIKGKIIYEDKKRVGRLRPSDELDSLAVTANTNSNKTLP